MKFEDILYEKKDGIAKVTINRPDVMNAFRAQTVSELIQAFQDAWDDDAVGVGIHAGDDRRPRRRAEGRRRDRLVEADALVGPGPIDVAGITFGSQETLLAQRRPVGPLEGDSDEVEDHRARGGL